jgi:glycosyltransferase involved in cell wall biosynthesis
MRVLHVLEEIRESGAEIMLAVAASIWHEHGHELHAVSIGDRLGGFAGALTGSGYSVHHHPLPDRSLSSFRAFVAEHAFDVAHVHPERGNFWVCVAIRSAGVRTVVRSIHSVFDFTGPLRVERTVQRWLLHRLGVKMVSVAPSVTESERERFRNPTLQIDNWVDTDLFRPTPAEERIAIRQELGLPPGPAMVSVGHCSPVKNHAMLLEALSRIDDQERDWSYLHIGAEDEGHRERRLAERLGLTDRVRFLGRRSHDETARIVRACDLFLMPSLYEGQGLAALEGLAAGLPAVLTDVPGLRDLRGTAVNVYWTRPTVPDLVRTVDVAQTRAGGVTQGERWRAHEAVRSRFDVTIGAERYAELYGAP